jgi:hypothetical protein
MPDVRTFRGMYPKMDLKLITAARLASGFPYVLPASRARIEGSDTPAYHIIDGGYYDNYGVATAVEWIDEGLRFLERAGKTPPPVLVLQIRHFPEEQVPLPKPRGWFFQTYAPIEGLYNVRTAAHVRDGDELRLLQDRWGTFNGRPRIQFATFEFAAEHAPFTFRMNDTQRRLIGSEWGAFMNDGNPDKHKHIRQVLCFLEGFTSRDCGAVRGTLTAY